MNDVTDVESNEYNEMRRLDETIREQRMILADREFEGPKAATETPRKTRADRRAARRSNPAVRKMLRQDLVAIGIVLSIATAIVAGAALFLHTFPPTPQGVPPVLTTSCSTLVQNGPTSIIVGQSGTVLYTCSSPPSPSSNALTAIAGSATPTFSLPGMSLSIVQHSDSSSTCSPGVVLSSGIPTTFTAGSFDYCVAYDFYPSAGIASFTVSWS